MHEIRSGITWALAGALFLFGSSQSLAYNGFEHHDISDFALALCLELLEQPSSSLVPGPVDPQRLETAVGSLQRLLPGAETKHGHHYGDLVVSVDHYRDLSEFLRVKEGQFFGDLANVQRQGLFRVARRHLRAVHGNVNHFQGYALEVFAQYHGEALRLAAAGDLQGALLHNAIADHFLQDFLASGHVVTPRAKFHDMTSASVHDFYNGHGAVFRIDTRGATPDEGTPPWKRLTEIARAAQLLPDWKPDGAGQACKRKQLDFAWQDLLGFVEHAEQVSQDGKASLVFHGDGALRREINQRSFVTLVVARSLLDVVLSYLGGSEIDQVGSRDWCWEAATAIPKQGEGKEGKETYALTFGYDKKTLCPPKARIAFGAYDLNAPVDEHDNDPRKRLKTENFFVKGLMLSISAQLGEGGLETGRRRLRLDYIPVASPPKGSIQKREPEEGDCASACLTPGRRPREPFPDESGLMVLWGYAYMEELDTRSHGPYLGALAPVGDDGQVRWWLGYRSFERDNRSPRKFTYGIGYEKGFGLLFVHADVERDFEFDRKNDLQARWTPSVGVNLMIPLSWLHH